MLHNNNNIRQPIQPPISSLYAGGFNNNNNNNSNNRAQPQIANQNRFNNSVLPPIGCNFNNNGNTPSVGGFGSKPKAQQQLDAFANKQQQQQQRSDFGIMKGGGQDLGLAGRTIQNGSGSSGVQSFYSSVIH